ncbi:pentatricopeptide repeat-containing protein At2g01510, mitochondrial-like [Wolffia australiana]
MGHADSPARRSRRGGAAGPAAQTRVAEPGPAPETRRRRLRLPDPRRVRAPRDLPRYKNASRATRRRRRRRRRRLRVLLPRPVLPRRAEPPPQRGHAGRLRRRRGLSSLAEAVKMPAWTKEGLLSLLKRCSGGEHLRQIHAAVVTGGLSHKNSLLTQLLLALAAGGNMAYARRLFDGMHKPRAFLWSSLLRGYAKNSLNAEAAALFSQMRRRGPPPDEFTFPFFLRAAAAAAPAAHALLLRLAVPLNRVLATELAAAYARTDRARAAELVLPAAARDRVAWNALIAAYARSGRPDRALRLLRAMPVPPDAATMASALSACAALGLLRLGRTLHVTIAGSGLGSLALHNALLNMYAKCGSLAEARRLFDEMPARNVVSWSAMVAGCALNGDPGGALALAGSMKARGVEPNGVTHLAVLSACAHAGLVSLGRGYFRARIPRPGVEHYAGLVDLLARAGLVEEAYAVAASMAVAPDAAVWGALLAACVAYRRTAIGRAAADRALLLAPDCPSYRVLLSNLYSAAGRWREAESWRKKMRRSGLRKTAGFCAVEAAEGAVEVFYGGDWSHARAAEIRAKLEEVMALARAAGYSPSAEALHDVEGEEREVAAAAHCEKIALAFALLGGEVGEEVRLVKNLRTCPDCHAFARAVSLALGVDLVVRDKSRFHRFSRGSCSCADFW